MLQSGQGEIQVAQLEGAVKQIAAFAQACPVSLGRAPIPGLCGIVVRPLRSFEV